MDTAWRAEKGRRSAAAFRRWMEVQRPTALATAPDRGARATAVGGTARAAEEAFQSEGVPDTMSIASQ